MNKLGRLDVKYLKGVGEARAALLKSELEISTLRDLIYTFPFKHIDRSRFFRIADFPADQLSVQVKGSFLRFSIDGEGARRRLIALFSDGTRTMEIVWFRRIKTISSAYKIGRTYVLFGKPTNYKGIWQMAHPEVEEYNPENPVSGIRGVYSLTEKLRSKNFTSRTLYQLVSNLFEKTPEISETLPTEVCRRHSLMPLREALYNMHFPADAIALQKARERLKFEELFYLQMHILRFSRQRGHKISGMVFKRIGEKFNTFFRDVLPFDLTEAQKRVMREIRSDMCTGRQMNRLLQGDVGSGKTMVAFMSMLIAADNSAQACLMAPTEILARQHFITLSEWASKCNVKVALLTGSIRSSNRRKIHEGLRSGEIDILVGTHAVIEDTVEFQNLGLAVIDEQHRFGVAQRAGLWRKGRFMPHVLVMTATPIPRTLAMTLYGDLDVSVIDELPPGRKPITTLLRYDENRLQVTKGIYSQLQQGRQVYIVFPLIRENEKMSLRSLEEGYERVKETFRDYTVCCVHGQMKQEEKDFQMQLFVSGEARIMVATTVIEVGVNVPNATVMVIENAERFGLSQLHQLRGRVGRGADESYCILMSRRDVGYETGKRLGIMTETTDGFLISEADMKIRGPGDMEGTQQSGLAFNFKVANLATDGQILQQARDEAMILIDANPVLFDSAGKNKELNKRQNNVILSETSVSLIKRELDFRFYKKMDWSRIS